MFECGIRVRRKHMATCCVRGPCQGRFDKSHDMTSTSHPRTMQRAPRDWDESTTRPRICSSAIRPGCSPTLDPSPFMLANPFNAKNCSTLATASNLQLLAKNQFLIYAVSTCIVSCAEGAAAGGGTVPTRLFAPPPLAIAACGAHHAPHPALVLATS